MKPLYDTEHGKAYLADALDLLPTMPDSSVNLIFTSPPYALHFKKEYGNVKSERLRCMVPQVCPPLSPALEG